MTTDGQIASSANQYQAGYRHASASNIYLNYVGPFEDVKMGARPAVRELKGNLRDKSATSSSEWLFYVSRDCDAPQARVINA